MTAPWLARALYDSLLTGYTSHTTYKLLLAEPDQEYMMAATKPRPIDESALLVIDVQESLSALPERWARRSNPVFVDRGAPLWSDGESGF